jgi:Viral BACON domain/Putative binding domain, N-terminal
MRRIALALVAICVAGWACDSDTPTTPTPTCTYTLSTSSFSFQAIGGSGSVTVAAQSGCAWTATSQSSWLSITSSSSGSGNAAVTFSAASNETSGARTGTLSIAGLPITVSQVGVSAPCEYVVSPDRTSFSKDAGSGTVAVTAAPSCAWSAASNAPWLTVTAGAQGNGNGTVSFAVSRNTTTLERRADLMVAAQTIAITQGGDVGGCQYSVAPIVFNVCMTAPALTTTITTSDGCPWTATARSDSPWLSVTGGSSGSGSGSITMRVSDNWDAPREGVVEVRWPTPTEGQNLRVSQAGCLYAVSPSAISIGATGGPGTFRLITFAEPNTCGGPLQDACVWTAQADVPWITIPRSSGRGDDDVSFTVAVNTTGVARTGRITVRDKTVVISQSGQ